MKLLSWLWPNSIKYKLIVSVALVHALLMSLFILDLVQREKSFLKEQSLKQTLALSETLASNSLEWTLSNNLAGLEGILNSQKNHPNLAYAMIVDVQGQVLAHTDPSKVGYYLSDEASLSFLNSTLPQEVIINNDDLIDVATNIHIKQNNLAWARAAVSNEHLNQNLKIITQEGFFYAVFAILVGSVISWVLGNSLTQRIDKIINATKKTNPNLNTQTFTDIQKDEIGDLMINFNQMEHKIQQQFKQIENIAHKDALTGLFNRSFFELEVKKTQLNNAQQHQTTALIFIDISRFKHLNDTYGHDQGDLLLQEIAKRIQNFIKPTDVGFRFGGDEFVILLNQMTRTLISNMTANLLLLLNEPYLLKNLIYNSYFSIGVTLFDGKPLSANELLKQADIALFKAKELGKNEILFFEENMEAEIKYKSLLDESLKTVLMNNELSWVIQPQVNMKTGKTIGGEVLLRWKRKNEFISPATFIPIAEDNQTIIPISNWLITDVFKFICHHKMNHLVISINLSPIHFFEKNLIHFLKDSIKRYEIIPYQIKFEITEGIFLKDFEETTKILNQLKMIGFKISLDDFGTGFSSLSYLKNLPIDQLKIDKSFIDGLPENEKPAAIAKTIINLTDNLNMEVIAEGVETLEQKHFLLQHGCDHCQGYLYSKPIDAEKFIEYAQKSHFLSD